ncbi:MAG: pyruvate ferredoxin oxidoreductase [Eubacteriales bacterium]|nr:pyruvate ferredoxin oxidoreductase [Eubacteriales bacterium]
MRQLMTGNYAASYAVKYAGVQVIAAYPITPQTQIVEKLSEMCAAGELKARYINVESEHSAMAACIGASSTGARVFTATSSQGLAYMHELLHWASRARLPVVMTNVNRAMAPGWNVWADQNDSLSQRDTGWMQIYCKSAQEVFDSILMAYKISEKVLLPTMINYDAFFTSHTEEPVDIPDAEKVRDFLPGLRRGRIMDVDDPCAFGTLVAQDTYTEFQYKIQESMQDAKKVITETCAEFKSIFNREYALTEEYKMSDADEVIIATSTMFETASVAVDELRKKGSKTGALRIRYFRPFPSEDIIRALSGKKRALVLDRNISFGAQGIFCQEVLAAAGGKGNMPAISGVVLGLGGR